MLAVAGGKEMDTMGHVGRGLITRLSVRGQATFVRLDVDSEVGPSNGLFQLNLTLPNYNAMYSLALAAAINRFPIAIRTVEEITPQDVAVVQYFNVDWAQLPDV
jgi:hypothetical protein